MSTLRDKFALAAMQGYMATQSGVDSDPETIADIAYDQADAMLSRRGNDSIKENILFVLELIANNSKTEEGDKIFDLICKHYHLDITSSNFA